MGLLYDITKDYLYQEGLTKGREELEESKREIIAKLFVNQKLSAEEIAGIVGTTVRICESCCRRVEKVSPLILWHPAATGEAIAEQSKK